VRKHRIKNINHIGFTTEDIDDIYMPNQLRMFASKVKASRDLSDNSEQEENRHRVNSRGLVQRGHKRLKPYETISNDTSKIN